MAVGTGPAQATGCPSTVRAEHGFTLISDGTATVQAQGVKLSTPEQASKVDFAVPVKAKLASVTEASYQTKKLDPGDNERTKFALAAYRLGVDVDGDGTADTTAVFEPYWQPSGAVTLPPYESTTWDVAKGVFWLSKTAGGLTGAPGGPASYTLADLSKAWPDAVVVAYGVGQGTYNEGAVSRVNHVRFAAGQTCGKHEWRATTQPTTSPAVSPTATPSPTATATASPTATASVSPTASSTASPTVTASASLSAAPPLTPAAGGGSSNGGGLPVTGAPAALMAGGALALLAAGGGLLLAARRRRTRFQA